MTGDDFLVFGDEGGGWVTAIGACLACGRVFAFNPRRVPSLNGEPICEACMIRVNALREARGEEAFPILAGAYEPCPESELGE